jgi:hypothetical protein
MERLDVALFEGVDVDGPELAHVSHGRGTNTERRLAIDDDQATHRASPHAFAGTNPNILDGPGVLARPDSCMALRYAG